MSAVVCVGLRLIEYFGGNKMILAFAHPGIVVPDLDKAIEFYSKMFGFKVIGHENWQDRFS